MLSPLPELFFLSPLAATLIRVAVAFVFARAAWKHLFDQETREKAVSVLEGVIAVALFLGFYTQYAALIGGLICSVWLYMTSMRPVEKSAVLLIIVMCVSLLVTGAGAFAFDLPL